MSTILCAAAFVLLPWLLVELDCSQRVPIVSWQGYKRAHRVFWHIHNNLDIYRLMCALLTRRISIRLISCLFNELCIEYNENI